VPREIKVRRAGCALWLEIDGYETPVDWIDAAAVAIGAEDGPDSVTVTFLADHVIVDAQDIDADTRVLEVTASDDETQGPPTQEAASDSVRVSEQT